MKNYVQKGETLTLISPYVVSSGDGVMVGSIFGVAAADYAIGEEGEFQVTGVFDLVRETGAGTGFSQGALIYWDNINKRITKTATGNRLIGVAVKAAADGDATGRVRLNGPPIPQVFVSTEQTGTGAAQSIPHGLGVTPSKVFVTPTDLAPATTGQFTVTEGTHTATNVVVTVTSGKKYKVIAIA